MFSEKKAFFLALNEVARVNPWIINADPEHDIVKIKMLVVNKLKKLGLQDLAVRIQKRATKKLVVWFGNGKP